MTFINKGYTSDNSFRPFKLELIFENKSDVDSMHEYLLLANNSNKLHPVLDSLRQELEFELTGKMTQSREL